MMVYRLAAEPYVHDLSGTGAKLFGGRWNPEGVPCIYTSEHISLALLEKFVHAEFTEQMERISLLQLEIPDSKNAIFHTHADLLKKSWEKDVTYSQWLGGQILGDQSVVAFSVPSAIIPFERNYILNPLAEAFGQIKCISVSGFAADFRLLRGLMQRGAIS